MKKSEKRFFDPHHPPYRATLKETQSEELRQIGAEYNTKFCYNLKHILFVKWLPHIPNASLNDVTGWERLSDTT